MRLVIISDTHNQHAKLEIPDGDVFIHCGDATSLGTELELTQFNEWLGTLLHKHKIYVPGNHDFGMQTTHADVITNATVLVDKALEIDGVKFYGLPWTPKYGDWAFMLDRASPILQSKLLDIPEDTDVLISHGPARGILDKNLEGFNCGCDQLRMRLEDLPNLQLHAYGHIHESAGADEINGVRYVNASVLNRCYELQNKPQVIEVE